MAKSQLVRKLLKETGSLQAVRRELKELGYSADDVESMVAQTAKTGPKTDDVGDLAETARQAETAQPKTGSSKDLFKELQGTRRPEHPGAPRKTKPKTKSKAKAKPKAKTKTKTKAKTRTKPVDVSPGAITKRLKEQAETGLKRTFKGDPLRTLSPGEAYPKVKRAPGKGRQFEGDILKGKGPKLPDPDKLRQLPGTTLDEVRSKIGDDLTKLRGTFRVKTPAGKELTVKPEELDQVTKFSPKAKIIGGSALAVAGYGTYQWLKPDEAEFKGAEPTDTRPEAPALTEAEDDEPSATDRYITTLTEGPDVVSAPVLEDLVEMPGGDKLVEEMRRYRDSLATAAEAYRKEKDQVRKRRMLAKLVDGIAKLAGAAYGLQQGIDMSGMEIPTRDWAQEFKLAREDLKDDKAIAEALFDERKLEYQLKRRGAQDENQARLQRNRQALKRFALKEKKAKDAWQRQLDRLELEMAREDKSEEATEADIMSRTEAMDKAYADATKNLRYAAGAKGENNAKANQSMQAALDRAVDAKILPPERAEALKADLNPSRAQAEIGEWRRYAQRKAEYGDRFDYATLSEFREVMERLDAKRQQ